MAPKKDYTPEQMGQAIQAVQQGEKIATAAKRFGVPRITLYNKVSGKSPLECAMGPQTVLSKLEEDILVKWLIAMSERHFPVNRELLMESVQKIIVEQGRSNPFTNNKPGKKWFQSFLKRHPDITEKTAQNLTKSRDDVSEEDLRKWFEEIGAYLEEKGLIDVLQDPSRVFNTDESAFFLSPKAGRVLCKRGEKHLYNFCGDEKENLTVLITANAAGQLAPPMIVFKYERVPAHISASVPDDWGIGKSESGWMCGSTFYEFIANIFDPWLQQQNIKKPVLFFLDGHKSHLTLHLSNYCSENGIEIIALYPNSTHILQPMDLAVFRPLKVAWRKEVSRWQLDHLGQTLKKENFAPVLRDSLATISQDCIQSGFRAGGLYPFGPDYIDMSKIKNKNVIQKEHDPRQSEFVKYLDSEIVKVFSPQKLELFNKMYYQDRHTVEQIIPPEDESLYVIWAKNKQLTLSANVLNLRNVPSTSQIDNNAPFSEAQQESVIFDAPRVSNAVPSTSETSSQVHPDPEASNIVEVRNTAPSTSRTENIVASSEVQPGFDNFIPASEVQREPKSLNILALKDALPLTSRTTSTVAASEVQPVPEALNIVEVRDTAPSISCTENIVASSEVQPGFDNFIPTSEVQRESRSLNILALKDAVPPTSRTNSTVAVSEVQPDPEALNIVEVRDTAPSTSCTENIVASSEVQPGFDNFIPASEIQRPKSLNILALKDAVPPTSRADNTVAASEVQPDPEALNIVEVRDTAPSTSCTENIVASSEVQPGFDNFTPTSEVQREPKSLNILALKDAEPSTSRTVSTVAASEVQPESENAMPSTSETRSLVIHKKSTDDHKSSTPQKHPLETVLGVVIPSPFKKNLFWPEEEVKEKKKRKREKIPYAVTSKAWQTYHIKKSAEKQKQIEEKEKRAKERKAKKILKERNLKDKKKVNRKKKHRQENTVSSSEDTDLEVTYAESDNSYTELHEPQDNDSAEEKEERVNTDQPRRRKSCVSTQKGRPTKRLRKSQSSTESDTESDDKPLSLLKVPSNPSFKTGQFVIVKYEGEYFPGKIEAVDEIQYEISTMVLSMGNSFRWPDKPDKIWYDMASIVESISDPLPLNKRGFYKIKEMEKYLPHLYL